jgi:hypothetical protein
VICENGIGYERNVYQTMSSEPSTCMYVLLCKKVSIPQLSFRQLDAGYHWWSGGEEKGEKDDLKMWKEEYCSGSHKVQGGSAIVSSSQSTTFVHACGGMIN